MGLSQPKTYFLFLFLGFPGPSPIIMIALLEPPSLSNLFLHLPSSFSRTRRVFSEPSHLCLKDSTTIHFLFLFYLPWLFPLTTFIFVLVGPLTFPFTFFFLWDVQKFPSHPLLPPFPPPQEVSKDFFLFDDDAFLLGRSVSFSFPKNSLAFSSVHGVGLAPD